MDIHNLFPTPLGLFDLGRDFTDAEIRFIKEQEQRDNMGNRTSVDNTILRRREMRGLRQFIEASLEEYFRTVYVPCNDTRLRITQSWCNYTEPGGYHHKHAHPNSFVSGVFYPQANRHTDRIYFYKAGFQQIKFPPENWNVWNSESWWFDVGTGDLVLFPSSLEHMVETVQGDQTRISLSFNTFPVGNIGEEISLTGLQIGALDGAFR